MSSNEIAPVRTYSSPANNSGVVNVIIVTKARSGSSFTGEIFNNNPDFAYFYEPLREIVESSTGSGSHPFGTDDVNRLRAIMQCNLTGTNYTWFHASDSTNLNVFCWHSNFFRSTALCKDHKHNMNHRGMAALEESCRHKEHAAIKVIRVPDIGSLKSLVLDQELNVKLIHLVRDPRAVEVSRNMLHWRNDSDHCEELTHNLRYWQNPPDWLKDRYMLLRYEDLAEDPLSITHQIYRFIGLRVPDRVKNWLKRNTNRQNKQPFSRTKVSNTTAHAWRKKIDYDQCKRIQEMCREPIMLLGYGLASSIDDLRNLQVPILTKFNYPLLPGFSETGHYVENEPSS